MSNTPPICASGAPPVIMPSANFPVCFALPGPAVATRIGGLDSGMVHSRVVSSWKYFPACLTSLPARLASNSLVMTSMASHIRRLRSPASGQ